MPTLSGMMRGVFCLSGAVMMANGAWMLAHALHWFETIPAGLADTGLPNGHFIRDVGLVYLLLGAALVWCFREPETRRPVFVLVALFMVGHAVGHLIEVASGSLPLMHLLIDAPVVLGPGALFGVFLFPRAWARLVAR